MKKPGTAHKLSEVIRELQALQEREGDIPLTVEGFFGEVMPAKFHLRHRSTVRNAYFCPLLDGDTGTKGDRVVEVSHL